MVPGWLTPLAALLPHAQQRFAAVPVALALAWMGLCTLVRAASISLSNRACHSRRASPPGRGQVAGAADPELELETVMSQTARPHASAGSAGWLAPAGLLLLGMLPVAAGAFRLDQLSGMSDVMPANPRFSAVPLPIVLHIVSATLFATMGPLQFAAGFRRRWPAWHRVAGGVRGGGV